MASKKVKCPTCHRNVKPQTSSDRRKRSCPNCGVWFGADDDDDVLDLSTAAVVSQSSKGASRTATPVSSTSASSTTGGTTQPAAPAAVSPTLAPPPFIQVSPHLVSERFDVLTRQRLYQRLRETYEHGYWDPELLYLGARYALSLGRMEEARVFLDQLAPLLKDEDRPSPAYLPIGLLLQTTLPAAERHALARELYASATGSNRLSAALRLVGCVASEDLLPDSPHQLLHVFERERRALSPQLSALLATNGDGQQSSVASNPLKQLQGLARAAGEAYNANDLARARAALESMLLVDGAQPDALRNLITVTSEQQDVEAYERYWRRYVKVLLWRVMCNDDAPSAYNDLIRFYSKVAVATDREFNEVQGKIADKLRAPGLLPRWLEAHAALVWLDALTRPPRDELAVLEPKPKVRGQLSHLKLMRYWGRVFYPEFYRFMDVGSPPAPAGWAAEMRRAPARPCLPFDPALVLLSRFAEWSNFGFWLETSKETQEMVDDEYAETISALGGCAARLHLQPYLSVLQAKLETVADNPPPFRRLWQEACSLTLRARRDQLWKAEDWAGVIAHYGENGLDPEVLDMFTPMSRLYVAEALCMTGQEEKGFAVACDLLSDLLPEEFDEEAPAYKWWLNIFYANLKQATESGTNHALTSITDRLKQLPPVAAAPDFIGARIKEVADYEARVRMAAVMEQVRGHMDANQFEAAVKLVKTLPETSTEIKEHKQSMLEQVQLEQVFERIKPLIRESKFKEAKILVRGVSVTSELGKTRQNDIMSQIEQIEKEHKESEKINKLVEDALSKAKACIGRGAYDEARQAIRRLPDTPADLVDLKRKFITQINEAETGEKTVRRENEQIVSYLRGQNIDFFRVSQIARDNGIDMANPYEYNSLLKAIQQQIRGW